MNLTQELYQALSEIAASAGPHDSALAQAMAHRAQDAMRLYDSHGGPFEAEAEQAFRSEEKDLEEAAALLDDADDIDEARAQAAEIAGEPLSVEFARCAHVLLTTGGPACGYDIWVDEYGEPESGYYWYQNWFQPRRVFWLDSSDLARVVQVYDLYLGE